MCSHLTFQMILPLNSDPWEMAVLNHVLNKSQMKVKRKFRCLFPICRTGNDKHLHMTEDHTSQHLFEDDVSVHSSIWPTCCILSQRLFFSKFPISGCTSSYKRLAVVANSFRDSFCFLQTWGTSIHAVSSRLTPSLRIWREFRHCACAHGWPSLSAFSLEADQLPFAADDSQALGRAAFPSVCLSAWSIATHWATVPKNL